MESAVRAVRDVGHVARPLRRVERAVGGGEQRIAVESLIGGTRPAHAERDRRGRHRARHHRAEPHRHGAGIGDRRPRQHDRELVAAPPSDDVEISLVRARHRRPRTAPRRRSWPCSSFTCLKSSMSTRTTVTGSPVSRQRSRARSRASSKTRRFSMPVTGSRIARAARRAWLRRRARSFTAETTTMPAVTARTITTRSGSRAGPLRRRATGSATAATRTTVEERCICWASCRFQGARAHVVYRHPTRKLKRRGADQASWSSGSSTSANPLRRNQVGSAWLRFLGPSTTRSPDRTASANSIRPIQ